MSDREIELLNYLTDEISDYVECLIEVDIQNDTFAVIRSRGVWEKSFDDCKSLEDLYYVLFMDKYHGKKQDNSYIIFSDKDFFKRDKFYGEVNIRKEEDEYSFTLIEKKVSDKRSIVALISNEGRAETSSEELEKVDTIQENFLFTMVVNLKTDQFLNPNTTEASASRRDFMDMKYSEWRFMISNMFMESDKPMFLRMSAPEYVLNTLEEKNHYSLELPMRNMTGEFIWVRLEFTRMKNFSKDNPRFVYTVKDINDDMQRLLRQESIIKAVEEQNKKLKEADENKTKYFSSMSHELRTPIGAIMGMNEAILREAKDENIISYAQDIKNASRLLLSSVNDILDYSKIEAGKMEIVPVNYSPKDMVERVTKLLLSKFADKGLTLDVEYDESIPALLFGDEIRITQILVNLLTNAAKYTQEGGAVLRVSSANTKKGFALDVSLRDTGIGIKEEDRNKLLDEYGRLDMLKNRSIEGTGLGMGIIVGLLNEMGSELQVDSEYGKGSTFSFVLNQKIITDAAECKSGDSTITGVPELSGKTIVVVDDTPVNLRLVYIILKETGANIIPLGGGMQCLKYLSDHKVDIVFLDHEMPAMDGIETFKEIRKLGGDFETIPVVALTANVGAGVRDEYISMGFADYLTKPYKRDDMYSVLSKVFGK